MHSWGPCGRCHSCQRHQERSQLWQVRCCPNEVPSEEPDQKIFWGPLQSFGYQWFHLTWSWGDQQAFDWCVFIYHEQSWSIRAWWPAEVSWRLHQPYSQNLTWDLKRDGSTNFYTWSCRCNYETGFGEGWGGWWSDGGSHEMDGKDYPCNCHKSCQTGSSGTSQTCGWNFHQISCSNPKDTRWSQDDQEPAPDSDIHSLPEGRLLGSTKKVSGCFR